MKMTERIEAYLNGEMSGEELAAFEALRKTDPALDQEIVSHQAFLNTLQEYGSRHKLISEMNAIHEGLNIDAIKSDVIPTSTIIRILWNKYRMNAAVAASVAILAVFATLFSTGFFSRTNALNSGYNALRREMKEVDRKIQRSKNEVIRDIKSGSVKKGPAKVSQYAGTGFALTTSGYIVTNNHVVEGADSVYVQSINGESYKVKTVYKDPKYDIAILQITDDSFSSLKSLPYTFKKSSSNLGEFVYTIGFPRDNYVLGNGYVSSETGFEGDTIQYQIDIPVNGGNSGGPLLDSKGNIIGVISGKQDNADGASFAIKSKYLLKVIDDMPYKDKKELTLNKKNLLSGLSRTDQIDKVRDCVFMVKVY